MSQASRTSQAKPKRATLIAATLRAQRSSSPASVRRGRHDTVSRYVNLTAAAFHATPDQASQFLFFATTLLPAALISSTRLPPSESRSRRLQPLTHFSAFFFFLARSRAAPSALVRSQPNSKQLLALVRLSLTHPSHHRTCRLTRTCASHPCAMPLITDISDHHLPRPQGTTDPPSITTKLLRKQSTHSEVARSVLMNNTIPPYRLDGHTHSTDNQQSPRQLPVRPPPPQSQSPRIHSNGNGPSRAPGGTLDGHDASDLKLPPSAASVQIHHALATNGVGRALSDTPMPTAPSSPRM